MVDIGDLKSLGRTGRAGSSPAAGTKNLMTIGELTTHRAPSPDAFATLRAPVISACFQTMSFAALAKRQSTGKPMHACACVAEQFPKTDWFWISPVN